MNEHRERSIQRQIGLAERPCPTCGSAQKTLSGDGLRKLRVRASLSLREVARRSKFSPAYVSDLELGRRRLSFALADDLLKAMGL
jgi:DNA-binding transcriptional regulator YiaG